MDKSRKWSGDFAKVRSLPSILSVPGFCTSVSAFSILVRIQNRGTATISSSGWGRSFLANTACAGRACPTQRALDGWYAPRFLAFF